jgi:hypothetical protein
MSDDIRDMLERGWREVKAIDEALSRGEIDEAAWYGAMHDLIIPKYVAAENPRAQSGHSGDAVGWERARSLVVEGIDRHGSFLVVLTAQERRATLWASTSTENPHHDKEFTL